MEDLDAIIEEIKENTYDNELADIYIRELLDQNKEYEWDQISENLILIIFKFRPNFNKFWNF